MYAKTYDLAISELKISIIRNNLCPKTDTKSNIIVFGNQTLEINISASLYCNKAMYNSLQKNLVQLLLDDYYQNNEGKTQ